MGSRALKGQKVEPRTKSSACSNVECVLQVGHASPCSPTFEPRCTSCDDEFSDGAGPASRSLADPRFCVYCYTEGHAP